MKCHFYPASRSHHAYCMAVDFGMKFKFRDGVWSHEGLIHIDRSGSYKIEIAEESIHLLEPQHDDLVCLGDDLIFWVCADDAFWQKNKDDPALKYNFIGLASAQCHFDDANAKIIQRNGVAFHAPESEEG
jgi:hypothetical protein